MSIHAESQINSPSDDFRDDKDKKNDIEMVDDFENKADAPRRGLQPPPIVAAMSPTGRVWVLMIMLLAIVSSASVTDFFPSVVQTLGFNKIDTLILTAPPYVLAVICAFGNSWHADKTGERFLHIAIPLTVGIASFILAAATTATAPRYVAMMLMVPSIYSGFVIVLAWISNTIPRPPAKRAAALAAINAVSNMSSIYASYMYSGAPRYIVAFSVDCCTLLLAVIMAAVLRIMLVRLNKKLDRGEYVEGTLGAGTALREGEAMRNGFRFLV